MVDIQRFLISGIVEMRILNRHNFQKIYWKGISREMGQLRPRHTRRQITTTRRGDKSPQQFASCDTVTFCENHCRCGRILSLRSVA